MNPFVPARLQADLVLASASPRRRELLAGLGFAFRVLPSDYHEDDAGRAPAEAARAHALGKAEAVALAAPGALVIGADTLVIVDGLALGKPRDGAEAAAMLRRLSGREHAVITGLALARYEPACQRLISRVEASETAVRLRALSGAEIAAYVASGEPPDKAGAYGIQGLAAQFVTGITGCYFNVMGLPLALLTDMLRAWAAEGP
ncbi:septum formation protein Maf [bacterium]|nr:septum formation protein Maf [bacterium]